MSVAENFDEKKLDEEEENLKSLTFNLLTRSSVYAVSQLVVSIGCGRKILWFLVLLIGLIGCSYETYSFLTLYFQYPVVITLEIENKWRLDFPAVSICNLNRAPAEYYKCLLQKKAAEDCLGEICDPSKSFEYLSSNSNEMEQHRNSCVYHFEGLLKSNNHDLLSLINASIEEDAGDDGIETQISSFVVSCSFNGEPCTYKNFSKFLSFEFGNCFTFNQKETPESRTLQTPYIGPISGLEVMLKLDFDAYSPLTISSGSRVVIHEANEQPDPKSSGFNISPGFETSVSIQQISQSRLPEPYRDRCKNYKEGSDGILQNQKSCFRLCQQKENILRCSCADPMLPLMPSWNVCDIQDKVAVCCLNDVKESSRFGIPTCSCPLPCRSTSFDLMISTAKWPAEPYKNEFMQVDVERTKPFCFKYFENDTEYQRKRSGPQSLSNAITAKLKVFYRNLEKTTYKQEPMFQDSELFSQLGGQMGLWLGISLVALFECIENISHLLHYCFKKTVKKTSDLKNSKKYDLQSTYL